MMCLRENSGYLDPQRDKESVYYESVYNMIQSSILNMNTWLYGGIINSNNHFELMRYVYCKL